MSRVDDWARIVAQARTVTAAFDDFGRVIRGMTPLLVILDEAMRLPPPSKRRPVLHNGRKPTARRKAHR